MGNKQQLQLNNETLASILSNVLGLPTQESLKHGAYVWKKLTTEGGDFVDFVVSDSPTAYPDGGEQGGYWYEKVVEGVDLLSATGCTKIAIDKFTFSSITSYSQELSHSLSEIPKVVFIIRNGVSTTANHINMIAYIVGTATTSSVTATLLYVDKSSTANAGVQSNGMKLTASTIKLNTIGSFYFSEGVEYTLITMA